MGHSQAQTQMILRDLEIVNKVKMEMKTFSIFNSNVLESIRFTLQISLIDPKLKYTIQYIQVALEYIRHTLVFKGMCLTNLITSLT